jgi:hypothetical protein
MSHSIKEAYGRRISSRTDLPKGLERGLACWPRSAQGIITCQNLADCGTPFDMPGFVRLDAALYYVLSKTGAVP